jgi:hypothetical protein
MRSKRSQRKSLPFGVLPNSDEQSEPILTAEALSTQSSDIPKENFFSLRPRCLRGESPSGEFSIAQQDS